MTLLPIEHEMVFVIEGGGKLNKVESQFLEFGLFPKESLEVGELGEFFLEHADVVFLHLGGLVEI